jgi:anti-sigma factor RsiW
MNDHENIQMRLHAFFDGELSPGEKAAVQDHLRECGECRDELDALQGLPVLGGAPALPYDFTGKILARIRVLKRESAAPSWLEMILRSNRRIAWSLSVLILLFVSSLYLTSRNGGSPGWESALLSEGPVESGEFMQLVLGETELLEEEGIVQ